MTKINEAVEIDLIPTTPDAQLSCYVCQKPIADHDGCCLRFRRGHALPAMCAGAVHSDHPESVEERAVHRHAKRRRVGGDHRRDQQRRRGRRGKARRGRRSPRMKAECAGMVSRVEINVFMRCALIRENRSATKRRKSMKHRWKKFQKRVTSDGS